MKLSETTPTGGNILIRLPDYQRKRERKTESGIYVPHLEGYFEHNSSHGTVIAVGEGVMECQVGDEVFFATLCIQGGLQNMGNDKTRTENTKDRGSSIPVFYLADEEAHYLYMPEKRLYLMVTSFGEELQEVDIHGGIICAIRNGEVICMNGYHIMKDAYDSGEIIDGVRCRKHGDMLIAMLHEVPEKEKKFEIVYAPKNSILENGDIVFTAPHCDLKLEGEFNYPLLPKGSYYVQESNIYGLVEDMAVAN